MQYKEQAHVRNMPQQVIIHSIEAICEGLVQDARYNFGREAGYGSQLLVKEDEGLVLCEVKFVPYDYRFKWLAEKEGDGYRVTFVGSTPDTWYEVLTRQGEKLRGLMDTQWAAFINFGIGYVTADYYRKGGHAKEHIKKAATRVVKRHKSAHKKTRID